MNKRELGTIYEEKTSDYIKKHSMKILEMNYRCKCGEVDIIAQDKNYLVFIEVKYRTSLNYGHPSQAVDYRKQRKIIQTAIWYIKNTQKFDCPIRFDVACWIGDTLEYHKGAFDYHE